MCRNGVVKYLYLECLGSCKRLSRVTAVRNTDRERVNACKSYASTFRRQDTGGVDINRMHPEQQHSMNRAHFYGRRFIAIFLNCIRECNVKSMPIKNVYVCACVWVYSVVLHARRIGHPECANDVLQNSLFSYPIRMQIINGCFYALTHTNTHSAFLESI